LEEALDLSSDRILNELMTVFEYTVLLNVASEVCYELADVLEEISSSIYRVGKEFNRFVLNVDRWLPGCGVASQKNLIFIVIKKA
jgi:hypothetical protein